MDSLKTESSNLFDYWYYRNCGFQHRLYGLQTTSAVNGALIIATTPLMTLLMTILLDGEKLTTNKFLGVLFGLSGVLLVISQGHITTLLHLKIDIGDLFILLGAFGFCLANVLSRRYVKKCYSLRNNNFFYAVRGNNTWFVECDI